MLREIYHGTSCRITHPSYELTNQTCDFVRGRTEACDEFARKRAPPVDQLWFQNIIVDRYTPALLFARNPLNVNLLPREDPSYLAMRGGAISIGNFDGVHQGHAMLIRRLLVMAQRIAGPSVVITFDPPPAAILRPDRLPPRLTTIQRRIELLRSLGVDHVMICQTTTELLNQTPETFFQNLIIDQLQARGMVEGPNFHFGKGRAGTTSMLRQLCDTHHITLEIVDPQVDEAGVISSTRIRDRLLTGEIELANQMLTAPFQFSGKVTEGEARGRQLGFPTANLEHIQTLVPRDGVYGARATLADGRHLLAAVHIGGNVTFGEMHRKVEVHLLDFQGDLYQQTMVVELLIRVRDTKRFESREELVTQMTNDVASIRQRLAT